MFDLYELRNCEQKSKLLLSAKHRYPHPNSL